MQMLVQQSVALKQRSPTDAQVAPDEPHTPPAQLSEQQSPLAAHLLPSVVQLPAPGMAAHLPPVQVWVQQSVPTEQLSPMGLQTAPEQLPFWHTPEQHSVAMVHAVVAVLHAPPNSAQVWLLVSQAPVQQPAPLTH
jgi:hypothetical protein